MGILDDNGVFHPLGPGMRIKVLADSPKQESGPKGPQGISEKNLKHHRTPAGLMPWVPDPVKKDRRLRLKYGVMIKGDRAKVSMDIELFKAAYIEKLQRLIEQESSTQAAVLLDRYFATPHLASGSPGEIALNMWEELEEVRRPVEIVRAWIKNPQREPFKDSHCQGAASTDSTVGEPDLGKELDDMSLDDFLALIQGGP